MKTAREIACDILTPYNLATPEEIAVVAEAIRSYGEAVREEDAKKCDELSSWYGAKLEVCQMQAAHDCASVIRSLELE